MANVYGIDEGKIAGRYVIDTSSRGVTEGVSRYWILVDWLSYPCTIKNKYLNLKS